MLSCSRVAQDLRGRRSFSATSAPRCLRPGCIAPTARPACARRFQLNSLSRSPRPPTAPGGDGSSVYAPRLNDKAVRAHMASRLEKGTFGDPSRPKHLPVPRCSAPLKLRKTTGRRKLGWSRRQSPVYLLRRIRRGQGSPWVVSKPFASRVSSSRRAPIAACELYLLALSNLNEKSHRGADRDIAGNGFALSA